MEIARFIAWWLEQAGLEVHWHEVAPNRPNVVGILRGTGEGKSLILNGHIDTVGVAGMTNPHQPYRHEGRLYERGVYDMKGGVAACMVAIAAALKPNWLDLMRDFFAYHPAVMSARAQDTNGFTLIHGDAGPYNIMVPREATRPLYLIDRQPFDWSLTPGWASTTWPLPSFWIGIVTVGVSWRDLFCNIITSIYSGGV